MPQTYTLYHGTTEDRAQRLLSEGWAPNSGPSLGANMGQRRYLYLTNEPENALWFAEQHGGSTVLEIEVPIEFLKVDPEDGAYETVEEEISSTKRTPGSVVLTTAVDASAFKLYVLDRSPILK